jgi:hypothetical protein
MKKFSILLILATAFLNLYLLSELYAADQCPNRVPLSASCLCNGTEYDSGYCCYYKVYPSNEANIVHQATKCGYTEVSPHYESLYMGTGGNGYYTDVDNRRPPFMSSCTGAHCGQEWDYWGKVYDEIGAGVSLSNINDFLAAKAINPKLKVTTYAGLNELWCFAGNCDQYQYLQQRASEDGVDFEDFFLHFQPGKGKVICNVPDGPYCKDYTSCNSKIPECRLPYFMKYWTVNDPVVQEWLINPGNPNYQKYIVDYYLAGLKEFSDNGAALDGIMIDNMGRHYYWRNIDNVDEGTTFEVADSDEWFADLASALKYVTNALNEKGYMVVINSTKTGYFNPDYADKANGFGREFLTGAQTTNSNAAAEFNNFIVPDFELTERLGTKQYAHFETVTAVTYGKWKGTEVSPYDCWEGYTLAREQMWNLATYYLVKYDGLLFMPGYLTWRGYFEYLTPMGNYGDFNGGHWRGDASTFNDTFDALKFDIGKPMGKFYVWKENLIDSKGIIHKIYRRDFIKGSVLVRFDEYGDRYSDCPLDLSASTSPAVTLDGGYSIVNFDGTIGQSISSVAMTIGQGIILMKDTPDTITTLPPVISDGKVEMVMTDGKLNATVSIGTNEKAYCKFSKESWIPFYDKLFPFSTTGDVSHSVVRSNLDLSTTYSIYIRCRNENGDINLADYKIEFNSDTGYTVTPGTEPQDNDSNPLGAKFNVTGGCSIANIEFKWYFSSTFIIICLISIGVLRFKRSR